MNDALEEFLDHVSGDLPRDELVTVITEGGDLEIVAVMIDVELDPLLIKFDCDGLFANIQTESYTYLLLSSDQLYHLSNLTDRAAEIWEKWNKKKPYGKDGYGEPSEKMLRKWLAMGDSGADLRKSKPVKPPRGGKPTLVKT